MTLKDIIKELCKRKGISVNRLESELGFAKGYVSKLDKSTPNSAKLQSIAEYFNVSLDYLMSGNKESNLSMKDQRDIAKDLDKIMNEIRNGDDGPLYYNGIEIDEASIGLLENAIEYALTQAKKENKVKYNPNKNKK